MSYYMRVKPDIETLYKQTKANNCMSGNQQTTATKNVDPKELAKLQLYQVIAAIPSGQVASYGQLAKLAGQAGAARWVGYCLRHLPKDSSLPWHRVITANGKLAFNVDSEGYWRQRELLQAEGITLHHHKVSMRRYQWQP